MSSYRFGVQAACLLGVVIAAYPASAQLQGVTGVQIEYKEPTNPAHRPIYERLKKRQVLEQYREFMSPLKLTRALNVSLAGCGVVNAFHSPSGITYCYELVDHVQRQVSETNVLPGFRREDAIVGGFVSTLLHETGHALFYLFDIPVFGREEDAADAIAAYVSLQFGPKTARRILTGTAFVWRASELANRNRSRNFEEYSDEHGTDAQRFYNTLCIAHGSDIVEKTDTFAEFVPLLPDNRRRKCAREYLHIKNSFARFVLPHVDLERMKKVRAMEWVRSEDGSEVAPPAPLGPRGTGPSGPGGPGPSAPGTFSPTGPGPGKPK